MGRFLFCRCIYQEHIFGIGACSRRHARLELCTNCVYALGGRRSRRRCSLGQSASDPSSVFMWRQLAEGAWRPRQQWDTLGAATAKFYRGRALRHSYHPSGEGNGCARDCCCGCCCGCFQFSQIAFGQAQGGRGSNWHGGPEQLLLCCDVL